jgi:hypothetical protein
MLMRGPPLLAQRRGQPGAGAEHPAGDRPRRAAGHVARFLVGQAKHPDQQERLALVWVEGLQGALEVPTQHRVGAAPVHQHQRWRLVQRDRRQRRPPCVLQRGPAGDGVQPGREARVAAEAAQPTPGAQEHLLGHVLGQGAVAEQAIGQGADAGLVGADELHERLAVPIPGRKGQRGVPHPGLLSLGVATVVLASH